MKRFCAQFLGLCLTVAILTVGADEAFAKRLGGGKSFGSRPSYSEPYRRLPETRPTLPSAQPGYSSATQRNQAVRESLARRGGLMGMLGGLALGGLLGALLFGGAFEHLNFLDIAVFALVAFLLFRLLAARRQTGPATAPAGFRPSPGGAIQDADFARTGERRMAEQAGPGAGFETDVLFRKNGASDAFAQSSEPSAAYPEGFDAEGFLSGAKAAYRHLQAAWDQGDLAELRALTTDRVFAELQDQRREMGRENRTEILKLEAELLEAREVGRNLEASVLFDVMLRESNEDRPTQVREVWHFVRDQSNRRLTWYLDGIQQLLD